MNNEVKLEARPLDLVISSGLLLLLIYFCYQVLHPFMGLLIWSTIFAIVFYPLHQLLVRKIGERQGAAASLLVILALVLVGLPVAFLSSSLADSVMWLVEGVRTNTLEIPMPPDRVADLPIVGEKLHAAWTLGASDLPALVHQLQPKIGDIARAGVSFVAGLGSGILLFMFSFVVAAILMAYGAGSSGTAEALAMRIAGAERGRRFTSLAAATVRSVALGVIGVAAIQALAIGVTLLIFGVAGAGILTLIALVLAIAQVPVAIVTLPIIAWVWMASGFTPTASVILTVVLLVAGLADNVLKPLLMGRGVDVPMPVVLLGAIGGMVYSGIQGLFVGAVVLAIGYQLLMGWVREAQIASPEESPLEKS